MNYELLRLSGIVAIAAFALSYGVVRASDARARRRWIATIRARGFSGDKSELVDAYLRGVDDGTNAGRQSAIREAYAREADIIASSYAISYNDALRERRQKFTERSH